MEKIALALCAHPDDIEFMCAGSLALLRKKGWHIHLATMTPGDCGSINRSREEISIIRRGEAADAAKILDGQYHCLECDDIFVMYDRPSLVKVIELIRKVKPLLVFTASPQDYMVDHESASKLTAAACFAAGIPNVSTPGAAAFGHIPHLYYVDPIDAKDVMGKAIEAQFYVDISSVIDTKVKMLCCHASQREWLMAHHGMDEYTASLKRHGAMRGKEIGVAYAEAFRQHLGHSYPQDNLLAKELGNLVHTK
jgi:LmbE family N-acetylglucosaminyl deacetylase